MTESNTASVLALRERATVAAVAVPPLTALYARAEGREQADGLAARNPAPSISASCRSARSSTGDPAAQP